MIYQPPRLQGVTTGLILALWAFALMAVLAVRAVTWPVSLAAFLAYAGAAAAAVLGLAFAYWSYACYSLRCILSRDSLSIAWGTGQQVIPLNEIERLVPGHTLPPPKVRGLNWWGHHVGRATVAPIGEVVFYSAHRSSDDLLYIVTAAESYAVSAENVGQLARDIQLRQRLGAPEPGKGGLRRGLPMSLSIWGDRWVWPALLLALALNLTLFAYLFTIYQGLPSELSLPFAPASDGERLGPKSDILKIPVAALAVLAINLPLAAISHRWERAIAHLLLATALGTQVLLWAAAAAAVT